MLLSYVRIRDFLRGFGFWLDPALLYFLFYFNNFLLFLFIYFFFFLISLIQHKQQPTKSHKHTPHTQITRHSANQANIFQLTSEHTKKTMFFFKTSFHRNTTKIANLRKNLAKVKSGIRDTLLCMCLYVWVYAYTYILLAHIHKRITTLFFDTAEYILSFTMPHNSHNSHNSDNSLT